MLASASAREGEGALRELETASRESLAGTQLQSLFFQLLRPHESLKHGSQSEYRFASLDADSRLPFDAPRELVFERVLRALGDSPRHRVVAFMVTVSVVSGLIDFTNFAGWLERGGHPVDARAALLHRLAQTLAGDDWLVGLYRAQALDRAAWNLGQSPGCACDAGFELGDVLSRAEHRTSPRSSSRRTL